MPIDLLPVIISNHDAQYIVHHTVPDTRNVYSRKQWRNVWHYDDVLAEECFKGESENHVNALPYSVDQRK